MREKSNELQTKTDKRERKRKIKMRVAGKSVFKIKEIITKKAEKKTR